MNIRSMLTKRPLLSAVIAISFAFACYHWLTYDECSPENKGPFDGTVLYSCTVKAVAKIHKGNVDPAVQQSWLKEWKNKYYDSYLLKTEAGTVRAITEMLMSMNERFDYFYTPEYTEKNEVMAQGQIAGIGVPISFKGATSDLSEPVSDIPEFMTSQALSLVKDKLASKSKITGEIQMFVAADPDPGTPAFNAGMRVGDRFIKINGIPVEGNMDQLIAKVRGPEGSRLTLTIESAGDHKVRNLHLVRQIIRLPVASEKDIGDLGYVTIQEFESNNTAQDVHQAVDMACGRTETDESDTHCKARALIIDLRNNPGGRLDYVIEVSELFLDQGKLATMLMRHDDHMDRTDFNLTENELVITMPDGSVNKYDRKTKNHFPTDRPIVVLVNKDTASGAEALAEMLQGNNKRAIIVGERTRGKGVGQCPIDLPYRFSMNPICMEYSVAGKSVDWVGVTPNVEVAQPADSKDDLQLAKAIEIAHNPALAANVTVTEDLSAIMKQRKAEFEISQQKIRKLLDL